MNNKKIGFKTFGNIFLVLMCFFAACKNPSSSSSPRGDIPVDPCAMITVLGANCITASTTETVPSSAAAREKGVFTGNRKVSISSFKIGQCEITQKLYKEVMQGKKENNQSISATPSYFKSVADEGEDLELRPVDNVTWYDAVYFCNAYTEKLMSAEEKVYTIENITIESGHIISATVTADITKGGYRLPTEAEWEFAARGADPKAADWDYYFAGVQRNLESATPGWVDENLNDYGWYTYSSSFKNGSTRQHHQVGKKKQNRLGLCDMSGNIYEWCWDYYNDDVTAGDAEGDIVVNPCGPVTGEKRVYRGGSWNSEAKPASVRYRSYATPGKRDFNNISIQNFHYGFRVACSIR